MILTFKTHCTDILANSQGPCRTSVELHYCMYFCSGSHSLTWNTFFLSHAKFAVMNVHTCCCFLCPPSCCWNMNDSKAVQDVFHRTVFSPQNHSIKCHLRRRLTCGEVNAVLLCNFAHFYLEITSPPSSTENVRIGNRFYTAELTLICT